MNLAKLTADDLPLFMGITKDLFPKIVLPVIKNDVLVSAIKQCMLNKNHQPSDSAIAKIVQLYETKISRHSVMILGQTGTAKTSSWKTLRESMILLKKEKVDGFETVIVSLRLLL
jgi:dynein heavy chain